MHPEARKLLSDLLEAARLVRDFTAGRALEDLKNDRLLKSGVYWQSTVIGEALSQLRRVDPPTLDRISEWSRIIGFRNQIIHGYSVIDDEITWRIVLDKLPILLKESEAILQEA